jgi:hypothetical protein
VSKFSDWKKIILFGAIGAIGCLLGGALAEPFLRWARPSQQADGGGTAGLMFNPDLTARLRREHAQSGDVQVSLMWNNRNDLDLHVIDPNGEEISYLHKRSRSGGWLDVDMNRDGGTATSQPVENIFWPAAAAPVGTYKVYVYHYANHGGADPTDYIVGVIVGGTAGVAARESRAREFAGRISHGQSRQLVHEFTVSPPSEERPVVSWHTTLLTAAWTALLAIGLSLALVAGQNKYLQRPLLSARQAMIVMGGGLVAGMIAGGIGHLLFEISSQHAALGQFSRVLGWLILGAILGRGMAYVIANLPGLRAAIAGAIGAVIAALAFVWITPIVSETAGRLAGAAILGLAIGLMVAIVEAAFREAWLEVRYSAKETRNVSLGAEAVSVGGDVNACTVYARNAAPVAFRYRLNQGQITCENVARGQTTNVQPGHSQTVGNLTVIVRTPSTTAPAQIVSQTQSSARTTRSFTLRLSNGKSVALTEGVKLSASDVPGLQASNGTTVAEVGRNPNDPNVLGLKNLSRNAWTATLANRDRVQVEPGRNMRITSGTKISFGSSSAEIESKE